jgi:hypothetical protein
MNMTDSKELTMGQTKTYDVDGVTLTLKPLPLGKIKAAMIKFLEPGKDNFEMITNFLTEMLNNGANPAVNREWLENHITLPIAIEMVQDARVINGLVDFLAPGAKATKPAPETSSPAIDTPTR